MSLVFMHTETVSYRQSNTELKGFLAYDNTKTNRRPAVIIAHAWKGLDEFARNKAKALAELGYVAFAADVYGKGVEAQSNEEAAALMGPLFLDRSLLLERIQAAYQVVCNHPIVDPKRIGGIGFCFGGLTIIELFRSGVDLRGVVSFHAVLGQESSGNRVKANPIAKNIKGSILILHGHDDPLVSAKDIQHVQTELTDAQVDWQMHIYGHTSHAFTVPQANDVSSGLMYNAKADHRSWQAMINFFTEIFK